VQITRSIDDATGTRRSLAACGAVAAWLLSACAIPVQTSDPLQAIELPPAWSGVPSAVAPPPSSPVGEWWRSFGDPTLDRLIDVAIAANTDIDIARANLRQSRALRAAATAASRPTLQLGASAQRNQPSGRSGSSLFDVGFDAAWEPDLFGAAAHTETAAAAEARASDLSLAAVRVSLAAEVAAGYMQLRGSQLRGRLARENLVLQEQTLQLVRWRRQAGLVSALDAEQAAAAVEQTRALLPALDDAASQAMHALAVLAGRPPQAIGGGIDAMLVAVAALPPPSLHPDAGIPALLLRRRPDLQAAEAQLQAAAARVAAADADRRPTLALRASLVWSALTLPSLGGTGAVASLLASVAQPLVDSGLRDARLDAQRAAFDAAQASYRGRVLVALQEVEDTLAATRSAELRLGALRAAEASASEAARLAEARYAGGIADFQTVLDTQRTRLAVQDNRAGAETELLSAQLRLVKALGGGWRDGAPSPAGTTP